MLKNLIDTLQNKEKIKFYITNNMFYSEDVEKISGTFVIGELDNISSEFPYPFILDCDNPIQIEVNNGSIIKFKQLSNLVKDIKEKHISTNKILDEKFYN